MAAPSCKLTIKAIPNAGRDEIVGWLGGALKVKIRAPALDGRANDALCAFLADALGLPKRSVEVALGEKSRQKCVLITGLSEDEVRNRLPPA